MASLVQRFPDVVGPFRRFVLLASLLAGCDPEPDTTFPDDVRIETGYFSDGGFVTDAQHALDASTGGGSDAAVAVFPDDAGMPADSDAGPATIVPCDPAECGAMPTTMPVCFDGDPADVECAPFVDRKCAWQFVCGP